MKSQERIIRQYFSKLELCESSKLRLKREYFEYLFDLNLYKK